MNDDIAIKVHSVSKTFYPQSSSKTIKQSFISLSRKLSGKKASTHQEGEYTALKDINFEVKKGEFFGIVGRNGCGKSTLLKIMAGVYSPTKGAVAVNGKLTPFIELGVGFNPELSGRDNVFLNGALLGFTRKQMEEMYDEIVNFAELHEFMDLKLKNYSSGMQVRLAFSVAIRAKSDILLIDEVLAVGDQAFQQKCFDYFIQLKKSNTTVVFISHDMGSVKRFCSRAAYISNGQILEIGRPSKVTDAYVRDNFGEIDNASVHKGEKKHKMPVEIKIILDNPKINQGDVLKGKLILDSNSDTDAIVGVSVLKDGVYVGGFNSKKYKPKVISLKAGNNTVVFSVNTSSLSTGKYTIGSGVFGVESFKPLGVHTEGPRITIDSQYEYKDGIADIDGDLKIEL